MAGAAATQETIDLLPGRGTGAWVGHASRRRSHSARKVCVPAFCRLCQSRKTKVSGAVYRCATDPASRQAARQAARARHEPGRVPRRSFRSRRRTAYATEQVPWQAMWPRVRPGTAITSNARPNPRCSRGRDRRAVGRRPRDGFAARTDRHRASASRAMCRARSADGGDEHCGEAQRVVLQVLSTGAASPDRPRPRRSSPRISQM